jgi:hypothetical protein
MAGGRSRHLPGPLTHGNPEGALDSPCGRYLNDPTAWT